MDPKFNEKCANEAIEQMHTSESPPLDVVEAAIKVQRWAEENGYRFWQIAGVCDRSFVDAADRALELSAKLHEIHGNDKYKGVWVLYHSHGFIYDGPTYERELANLDAELAKRRTG